MNLYFKIASYIVVASVAFSAAWGLRGTSITSLKLQNDVEVAQMQARLADTISSTTIKAQNERISIQRAARAEAENRIATQREAERVAQVGLRAAADDRVRLAAAGDGLRDVTAAMRASHEDLATCHWQVSALTVVLDRCSERYETVAGDAQEWYLETVKQNKAAQQ